MFDCCHYDRIITYKLKKGSKDRLMGVYIEWEIPVQCAVLLRDHSLIMEWVGGVASIHEQV